MGGRSDLSLRFARLAWLPIGILAGLAMWLLVSPMFTAWFGVIDDYEIVAILGPRRHLDLSELAPSIGYWIGSDTNRVRPLRWAFRVAEAFVWGANPPGMYFDRLILAGVTAASTGLLALRYVPSAIAALTGLLVIVGLQSEIWYRLGPQETYAVPLFMGGLALIAHGRTVGLVLVVLAALTKEAFIPMGLLAVGWAWTLGYRSRALVTGAVLVGIGLVVAYVLTTRGEPFGQVRTVSGVLSELRWMLTESALVTAWPVLAVALFVLAPRVAVILSLIAGAIFIPQAILDVDMHAGRYLLPAALGAILVVAAGLAAITTRWPRAGLVATYAVALLTIPALLAQSRTASQAAADTRAFHDSVDALEEVLAANPGSVLVVRPADLWDFEPLHSLRWFVPVEDAMFLPPPKRLTPPTSDAIEALLIQASRDGGMRYAPWKQSASCVEADFHVTHPEPVCEVVVVVRGWAIP